jgi:hypothetical protein
MQVLFRVRTLTTLLVTYVLTLRATRSHAAYLACVCAASLCACAPA